MKIRKILGIAAVVLLLSPATALADSGYYIASSGETVASIAADYALDSELVALMNDLDPDAVLEAGTLLRLPQTPCVSVTVVRGDTLSSLAEKYHVEIGEIAELNNLAELGRIYEGQTLLIPFTEESSVSLGESTERTEYGAVYASRAAVSYNWPAVGFISSPYGERWGSFHWGLDIAADNLSNIGASASGVVIESGWKNDAYGYAVMIDHGNGYQTLYAHCSSLLVNVGEWVESGQPIALVGSTGNSTGPHVHFEIRSNGVCVDPLLYLPARETTVTE